MKLYKLPIVLYEPSEDTNDMYMAEVPAIPGCRAWGDSIGDTMDYIRSVAELFIESYMERNHPLPVGLRTLLHESQGAEVYGEVIVEAREKQNEILSP